MCSSGDIRLLGQHLLTCEGKSDGLDIKIIKHTRVLGLTDFLNTAAEGVIFTAMVLLSLQVLKDEATHKSNTDLFVPHALALGKEIEMDWPRWREVFQWACLLQ